MHKKKQPLIIIISIKVKPLFSEMTSIQWADLPKELLEMIGKRLDSRVDTLRFRAVCTSWRSSVSLPSSDQEIPPLILNLPGPISYAPLFFQTTICRMDHVHKDPDSSSSSKSWLVKVGESNYGKLKLFNPLTNQEIKYSPIALNLLEFKFVELSKAFLLKSPHGFSVDGINKVVLFRVSANSSDENEFGILAIFHEVELAYWKYGAESWITLGGDENVQYDDITVCNERVYVVDRCGTVSWISPVLNVTQYYPSLYCSGGQKDLVECCGDLYVVDRYLDGERRRWVGIDGLMDSDDEILPNVGFTPTHAPKAIDFRVYKMDEDWGKWIEVKSLDDKVFVLGMDCSFSVSCKEFNGVKGNCIYYMDGDDYVGSGLSGGSIHVFQLEDRSIHKLAVIPEFSEIFWPPSNVSSV
jgi:hypothetical protein